MFHQEYKINYGNTVISFYLVQECFHEKVMVKFRSGQPSEGGGWGERGLLGTRGGNSLEMGSN